MQVMMPAMAQPPTLRACCDLLEVGWGASPQDIRRAYRRAMTLWHPDRFLPGSDLGAEAVAKTKAINEAYEILLATPFPAPPEPPPVPRPGRPPRPAAARSANSAPAFLLPLALVFVAGMAWKVARSSQVPTGPPEAALAAPSRPPVPLANPAEAPARAAAGFSPEPGVIIFSPSPLELADGPAARTAKAAEFLENASEVRELLRLRRPDVLVQVTEAQNILLKVETVHRPQTGGFGYILYGPPAQPKVMEGPQHLEKLMEIVNSYFPRDGMGTQGGPALALPLPVPGL